MKKLLMLVLVSACIVGLLVGCTKGSNYKPVQVENVSISIEDVSSTGGIVIIKDTNEEPYTYGEWYKIEKNSNGKWIEVDTVISDYGFNEIGYLTNEDGEVRIQRLASFSSVRSGSGRFSSGSTSRTLSR